MHGMAHDLVSCIRWDPHPQAIQKKEGFIRESGAAKSWYSADIPSGYVNSLLLKMAIEIVSFTINSMVMFHSYVKVYQRVVFFCQHFSRYAQMIFNPGFRPSLVGSFFFSGLGQYTARWRDWWNPKFQDVSKVGILHCGKHTKTMENHHF